MSNSGVHLQRYSSTVAKRPSPSPLKDVPTFYYQSDGSGRDSYVLMDNGGLRPEYDRHKPSVDKLFFGSLRKT